MDLQKAYEIARDRYAEWGVDTEAALTRLDAIPLSLHCWQGDDVMGFETFNTGLTGGIQATGNYPGRARNLEELQRDLDEALRLIPGPSKVNLHASYLATPNVDRDAVEPKDFAPWADWAVTRAIGLDFNPTFISHPKSADGYTLASPDAAIREFWIEHLARCRRVAAYLGQRTGKVCIHNIWIPDGEKELPVDSLSPRQRLTDALDRGLSEKVDDRYMLDAVESKLFGIGSEAYVVGSHEYYIGYALSRGTLLTLDSGHYHPTEVISGKFTALLLFVKGLLLHVSRPMRWDSDHVVLFDDELRQMMREIVRNRLEDRVYIGNDYFDASINRIAAWVIGTSNTRKALLAALLEPTDRLRTLETEGDRTSRLALTQELLTLPLGAVWDEYCHRHDRPEAEKWLPEVKRYEKDVLAGRG